MNEIIERSPVQLPDTLEDLTQFVLVSRAKLQAYMVKLQAVNKLSVAQEIRDQTLKEAQEISNALIAAEQRIGELLLSIPKQSANQYTSASSPDGEKAKTKAETAAEMGYSRKNVDEFQQMAKNPEIVQKVIEDALANGEVVTKSQVLKEIKAAKEQARAEGIAEAEANKSTREKFAEQKADRLLSENEKLERKIAELEFQLDDAVAAGVPDDYEKLKNNLEFFKEQARLAEEARATAQKNAAEMKIKLQEIENHSGVNAVKQRLENESEILSTNISSFLRSAQSFTWIPKNINDLDDNRQRILIYNLDSLKSWAHDFIESINRNSTIAPQKEY